MKSPDETPGCDAAPMTAIRAEHLTGLTARELMRPALETETSLDLYPDDPAMRYQLGAVVSERRVQPHIEGVNDAFDGTVPIFHLKAWGASWASAVSFWKRNQVKP